MTPAQFCLSYRAVELPGWPYRPGVHERDADGIRWVDTLPDLDDPATGGVLMHLLGDGVRVELDGDVWTVGVPGGKRALWMFRAGDSLAHACCAAAVARGMWR